jgi:hypothetical protein
VISKLAAGPQANNRIAGAAIAAVRDGTIDASFRALTTLAGLWIWMPGVLPGTEWGAYYQALARTFGLTIDTTGPSSGTEPLLDVIAASPAVATLVGEQIHLLWPDGYDLRRIALHHPTPVYPHSLLWRRDNSHPALSLLRTHFGTAIPAAAGTWVPDWA